MVLSAPGEAEGFVVFGALHREIKRYEALATPQRLTGEVYELKGEKMLGPGVNIDKEEIYFGSFLPCKRYGAGAPGAALRPGI